MTSLKSYLFEGKKDGEWVDSVKTKQKPPKGLFADGTAQEIADWVIENHDDAKTAIASIDFYMNRGGKNISQDRLFVLRKAKRKVERALEPKLEESKLMEVKDSYDDTLEFHNEFYDMVDKLNEISILVKSQKFVQYIKNLDQEHGVKASDFAAKFGIAIENAKKTFNRLEDELMKLD